MELKRVIGIRRAAGERSWSLLHNPVQCLRGGQGLGEGAEGWRGRGSGGCSQGLGQGPDSGCEEERRLRGTPRAAVSGGAQNEAGVRSPEPGEGGSPCGSLAWHIESGMRTGERVVLGITVNSGEPFQ